MAPNFSSQSALPYQYVEESLKDKNGVEMTPDLGAAQVDGRDVVDDADIETSSLAYANRFASPAGRWILNRQKQSVLDLIKDIPGKSVLDIGGGHDQNARMLVDKGYDVTVAGSSTECANQIKDLVDEGKCKFVSGDLTKLPFPDHSFDVVISLRHLSHCKNWQTLISEMCRISKHSVVIDYAPLFSSNLLYPVLFSVKKQLEGNTRQFLIFRHSTLKKQFVKERFALKQSKPQCFLPIVLHRKLNIPKLSEALESIFMRLGLTRLAGSPVIVQMVHEVFMKEFGC